MPSNRPFIDGAGRIGSPKAVTTFKLRGKSIQFRLLDDRYMEMILPDRKIRVTRINMQKLAYWILDNQPIEKQ